MIPKPLDRIEEADLAALIANAVAEGRTIEYKRQLPGNSDDQKREFLADASSFANTSGGDLVFGLEESSGVPVAFTPLTGNLDAERARLDAILASSLDPRIRYAMTTVACSQGPVIVMRIDRSWAGPHRVTFRGHDKFYGRNASGKYALDVTELRDAFNLSQTAIERIRSFRAERIMALAANQTPIPFKVSPKIVLHVIPVDTFAGPRSYDVLRLAKPPSTELWPFYASGWGYSIDLEGVMAYSGNDGIAHSYTHVYRNGIIEVVEGRLLDVAARALPTIPSISYEEELLKYVPYCLQLSQMLGVAFPVAVALTLIGVRGLRMSVGELAYDCGHDIRPESIVLPEAIVNDPGAKPTAFLRPLFDPIWNACGHPKSRNFDDSGNWAASRRR